MHKVGAKTPKISNTTPSFLRHCGSNPTFHPTLIIVQMCGMFVLEDSKSIVDMLVKQGKDRAAMEEQLAW